MNINRKWIFIVIAVIFIVGILYLGQDTIFNFKKNPKISASVDVLTSKMLITNEEIGILTLENIGKSNAIELEVEEVSPFTVTLEAEPPLLLEKGKAIIVNDLFEWSIYFKWLQLAIAMPKPKSNRVLNFKSKNPVSCNIRH